MEIPRSYIDNFTRGINTISEGAQKALARELAALDYSDMTAAINKAVGIMESYCATTSDATARLAAQFYRGMSVLQTGEDYQAEAISGHVPVATEKATRGIAQEGVDGNIAGMIKQLAERVDYEAKRAAGETVMGNARRDRRRVRYARVPSGNETCMFCIMLASRGFVYHSAESAGELNHYHANCDCRIVPSFAAATVPGYDPAEYYRIWKSGVLPTNDGESVREDAAPSAGGVTEQGKQLVESIKAWPVRDYLEPGTWDGLPSESDVIDLLGGGDRTSGSCASLALAYFGNLSGLVVRDFRGGASMRWFSTVGHIRQIANLNNVSSIVETNRSAIKAAQQALAQMQAGRQYFLCVGQHAAVVELRGNSYHYLELQTNHSNGWHELTAADLRSRFGCTKSRTIGGMRIDQEAILIDGTTLIGNPDVMATMGYINTAEDMQLKGSGGHAK